MSNVAKQTENTLEIVRDPQIQSNFVLQVIEKIATLPEGNIEKMEKLMELQERWEKKEARKSFFEALANFQATVPTIIKNNRVVDGSGRAKYQYANLNDIVKKISPTLKANGLSFRFAPEEKENIFKMTCIITHIDGHAESTTLSAPLSAAPVPKNKFGKDVINPIQARGAMTTYLMRYSLIGALGITSAEEDRDASGAAIPSPLEAPKLIVPDEVFKKAMDFVRANPTRKEEALGRLKQNYYLSVTQQTVWDTFKPCPAEVIKESVEEEKISC